MALQASLPCGATYAISALEWLGQCMSMIYSETAQLDQGGGSRQTSRSGQVEEIAIHILAHLAVTTDDSSSGLTKAVKAFTQSATSACFQNGHLFHALFWRFPRTIFQVPLEAATTTKYTFESELLRDKHLASICSALLVEGVPLPVFTNRVLFMLLEKEFFKTAVVLVEHGVDVRVLDRDDRPVLWTAVQRGDEEVVRSILKAEAEANSKQCMANRVAAAKTRERCIGDVSTDVHVAAMPTGRSPDLATVSSTEQQSQAFVDATSECQSDATITTSQQDNDMAMTMIQCVPKDMANRTRGCPPAGDETVATTKRLCDVATTELASTERPANEVQASTATERPSSSATTASARAMPERLTDETMALATTACLTSNATGSAATECLPDVDATLVTTVGHLISHATTRATTKSNGAATTAAEHPPTVARAGAAEERPSASTAAGVTAAHLSSDTTIVGTARLSKVDVATTAVMTERSSTAVRMTLAKPPSSDAKTATTRGTPPDDGAVPMTELLMMRWTAHCSSRLRVFAICQHSHHRISG